MSILRLLLAQEHNPAIYLCHGDVSLSYKQVNAVAMTNSVRLKQLFGGPENLAIFAGNSAEYVLAYWSAVAAGSTLVPIEPRLTVPEALSEIDYCDVNWIVHSRALSDRAREIRLTCGVGLIEISPDGAMVATCAPTRRRVRANGDDIAMLLHTSGTTGAPKKVMLSHRNLLANVTAHVSTVGLGPQDTSLIVLPMHFGYCNCTQLLAAAAVGARIVIYAEPVFHAAAVIDVIEALGVSTSTVVPTMLTLLDRYRYLRASRIPSLRSVLFGGGPVSDAVIDSLQAKLPDVVFHQTYGQTECSPRVTIASSDSGPLRNGTVGRPIPGVQIDVAEPNGRSAGPMCDGEIRVRGPGVMAGYYRRPDATAAVLADGWLSTGDIGFVDEAGVLHLRGRRRSVIIVGGQNVYPEEIETLLCADPRIKDVRVLAEPDEILGEVPCAEIVAAPGETIEMRAVEAILEPALNRQKWPRRIRLVASLPKTANGKVSRTRDTPS